MDKIKIKVEVKHHKANHLKHQCGRQHRQKSQTV